MEEIKTKFQAIGYNFAGFAYGINWSSTCYKFTNGLREVIYCPDQNACSFEFLGARMVQTPQITLAFLKK